MEELLPALATALAGLRRAPGNNLAWVDDVLRKLQRQQPDECQQLRRVHGLALRIAELDGLGPDQTATLTAAMFLATIAGVPQTERTDPRPWLDYLRKPWLEPALQAAALIADPAREPHGLVAIIAATAARLDEAAIFRSTSTVAVLRGLRAQARSRETEQLAELLWSEEGQELCDLHGRMRGQPYRFETATIKAALETLKALPPAAPSAPPPARRETKEEPVDAKLPPGQPAKDDSANFERRKQVLAVHGGLRQAFSTGVVGGAKAPAPSATLSIDRSPAETLPAKPDRPAAPSATLSIDTRPAETLQAKPDQAAAERDEAVALPEPEPEASRDEPRDEAPEPLPAPASTGKDDKMTNNRETTTGRSPDPELSGTLRELRSRLLEIERASAEAQQLLATLQPSIEELTAMLGQFETILGRWHAPSTRAA